MTKTKSRIVLISYAFKDSIVSLILAEYCTDLTCKHYHNPSNSFLFIMFSHLQIELIIRFYSKLNFRKLSSISWLSI